MKLTQAISNWLHKMFAWWPWKQPTQTEYSPHVSSINKGTTPETLSKSINDGIVSQTGIAPRLSNIQEWPERVVQTDVTATNELQETISSGDEKVMNISSTPTGEPSTDTLTSPTTQQRLEFLQYLIKHGIVNEGLDDEK